MQKLFFSSNKNQILFCFIVISLLFTSCDLPKHYFSVKPKCVENNEIFKNNEKLSSEYQNEVKAILHNSKPEDFRYYFKTFLDEEPQIFMLVEIRNESHCFEAKMLIEELGMLEGMHNVNGKSYPKELYDLEWKIERINGKEEIVFQTMHRIID